MNGEQAYVVHLLSCALKNIAPNPPTGKISWKNVRKIAEKQKILPLLFEAVRKLDKKYQPVEEIMRLWENETLSCTFFYALQMQHIIEVLNKAEKKGVEMLILKGAVLRELYPVPELRTMGDFDIIIRENQMKLAEEVFNSCGYEISKENTRQLTYCKQDALKIEVFSTIPSGLKSVDGRCVDIWANTLPFIEHYAVRPSWENMLLHSVTHLIKHLRTRGAGIRNFADIVLILEKTELDWEYILNELHELKAEKLFYGLLNAAEKYFDYKSPLEIPDVESEYIDRLMDYMLTVGVYGEMENEYILDAREAEKNRAGQIKNYFNKMFPSASYMAENYAYVKKCPVLLPVAWIHRIYKVVFRDGKSVGNNIQSMKTASSLVNTQMEILEYFNIN